MTVWTAAAYVRMTRGFRLLAAIPLVVTALATSSPAWAFGVQGHIGMYRAALDLLEATDNSQCATEWPGNDWVQAAYYPDAGTRYSPDLVNTVLDPVLSALTPMLGEERVSEFSEWIATADSANSSDHYFDPACGPGNVAGFLGALQRPFPSPERCQQIIGLTTGSNEVDKRLVALLCYLVPALPIPGQQLTFNQYLSTKPGQVNLELTKEEEKTLSDWLTQVSVELAAGTDPTGVLLAAPNLPGRGRQRGPDGDGYNAVTSLLLLLNGRADGVQTNPCILAPPEGAVALLRQASDRQRTGKDGVATAMEAALIDLGSAVHYVGDLHSPGHTDWWSWPMDHHRMFDLAGDAMFVRVADHRYLPSVELQAAILQAHEERETARWPSLCLLTGDGVCKAQGAPDMAKRRSDGLWDTDLGAMLMEAATDSRDLWALRPDVVPTLPESTDFPADALKALNALPEPVRIRWARHMAKAVRRCAGVIDWTFSRAAEPDFPYGRDATNFAGMAAGVAMGKAANRTLLVKSFNELHSDSLGCSLGGADRDDYFIVEGSAPDALKVVFERAEKTVGVDVLVAGFAQVDLGEGRSGLRPTAYPLFSELADGRQEIDLRPYAVGLGGRPGLIRVYSPDGHKCRYRFETSPVRSVPPTTGAGTHLADAKALVLPFICLPGNGVPDIPAEVAEQYTEQFWSALSRRRLDVGTSYREYDLYGTRDVIDKARAGDAEAVRELAVASGRRWIICGTLTAERRGRMFARVSHHDALQIHAGNEHGHDESQTGPFHLNAESVASRIGLLSQIGGPDQAETGEGFRGWLLRGGVWREESGVLSQTEEKPWCLAWKGRWSREPKDWVFTYEVEARKIGGEEGFLVVLGEGDNGGVCLASTSFPLLLPHEHLLPCYGSPCGVLVYPRLPRGGADRPVVWVGVLPSESRSPCQSASGPFRPVGLTRLVAGGQVRRRRPPRRLVGTPPRLPGRHRPASWP